MFSAFLGVCFTENKWSTENIFLVNWKSSHFSVKYLTDLKNVKHFTSFFFLFFFVKYFPANHFPKNIFPKNVFPWNKLSLRLVLHLDRHCCTQHMYKYVILGRCKMQLLGQFSVPWILAKDVSFFHWPLSSFSLKIWGLMSLVLMGMSRLKPWWRKSSIIHHILAQGKGKQSERSIRFY